MTQIEDGSRLGLVQYERGERQGPHAHPFTTVSIVLGGRVSESTRSAQVDARPLHRVVKPAGTVHENHFLGDGDTVLLQVGLSPGAEESALEAGCPLTTWRWEHQPGGVRAWTRLAWLIRRQESDRASLADMLYEVLGALGPIRKPSEKPPSWLVRAKEAFRESHTVAEVATEVGVHRVHFSREFCRYFGVTPTEYRTHARVVRAAGHLADSRSGLARVAQTVGFSDQAHMCRVLKTRLGITPMQYRSTVAC
jgi:AraC family transcriptional regulator